MGIIGWSFLLMYIGLLALWTSVSYWYAKNVYNWDYLTSDQKQKYQAFERRDRHRWNFFVFLFGSIFLFSIRLPMTITLISFNGFLAWILTLVFGVPRKTNVSTTFNSEWIFRFVIQTNCRLLLLVCGIFKIEEHKSQKRAGKNDDTPNIIVSNHVSILDSLLFICTCYPYFVAKRAVESLVGIAVICRVLGCIFLDRFSKTDRERVLGIIKVRLDDAEIHGSSNPMLMFAEGTTTNGYGIIPFRKGGFSPLKKIQPCLIRYSECYFSPSCDLLPTHMWFALFLSAPNWIKIDMYWLDPVSPPPSGNSEDERIEEFSKKVRRQMFDLLLRISSATPSYSLNEYVENWNGSIFVRNECEQYLIKRNKEHSSSNTKKS